MYKLCFFAPETETEAIKQALFAKGAGEFGLYSCCSWQVLGDGQFKPLKNSQPYLGTQEQLESVKEYKVEMICKNEYIIEVVKTLLKVHPYQEPAYEVYKILTLEDLTC